MPYESCIHYSMDCRSIMFIDGTVFWQPLNLWHYLFMFYMKIKVLCETWHLRAISSVYVWQLPCVATAAIIVSTVSSMLVWFGHMITAIRMHLGQDKLGMSPTNSDPSMNWTPALTQMEPEHSKLKLELDCKFSAWLFRLQLSI